MDSNLKDKIIQKIRERQVKMKPKIYFLFRSFLIIGIFVGVLILSSFLFSFVHFYLVSSGIWHLPRFGLEGIFLFFKSLPWLIIILGIFSIFILETLSLKFRLSFQKPLLFSLFVIFFIVLLGAFFLNKSNFHFHLLRQTKEGKLFSPVRPLYLEYPSRKFKKFHRGTIEKVSTSSLFIQGLDGETIEVKFEKPPLFFENLKIGDSVVVFGERENGRMRAKKIRKIKDKFLELRRSPFPLK